MPPLISEESLELHATAAKDETSVPPAGHNETVPPTGASGDQAMHDILLELSELKSHAVHTRTDIARSAARLNKTTVVAAIAVVLSIVLAGVAIDIVLPSARHLPGSAVAANIASNANVISALSSELDQLRAELKNINARMVSRADAPEKAEGIAKPPARIDCANLRADVKADVVDFSIRFDVGSTRILADSEGTLDGIAKLLALSPDLCVLIEGYTDETGDAEKNMALSKERAGSVASYLAQKPGIKRDRLVPIGKGSSSSVPGVAPSNPLNRRVVFKVVSGSD